MSDSVEWEAEDWEADWKQEWADSVLQAQPTKNWS